MTLRQLAIHPADVCFTVVLDLQHLSITNVLTSLSLNGSTSGRDWIGDTRSWWNH